MDLEIDFKRDWHETLRFKMDTEWGLKVDDIPNEKLPIYFFDFQKRRIDAMPREIKISDVFDCSKKHQKGWIKIQKDFKEGNDLTPHLHKAIERIESLDRMLNDWGIHHFHLGHKYETDSNFMERSGPLLFGIVTSEVFYAINIFLHGDWEKQDILEIVHRNWPELLSKFNVKGLAPDRITDSQKKELRRKNVNSMITVLDGTMYFPIGGGMTMSGANTNSVFEMDRHHIFLEDLEACLIKQNHQISDELKKQGYTGEEVVKVKLNTTENAFWAVFPDFHTQFKFETE